MLTYEQRLDRDPRWALDEGGRHFEGRNAVRQALERVCRRLADLQIPYAVVGGMALFHHGYRRFTEDVDLIVDIYRRSPTAGACVIRSSASALNS
jgi:hypothetical protein